ncbi:fungal-specific transcription factor domain-containing protein [Plectosphaerella plurivora]|uniref:Fungal-specific transcription factor domain-containing protein n=1 Tax=Plectosphaerella plurivora TaxID=936078 RepID=A0A9P9ACP5_9PEZI|nr:fungal-specific transcription factor domain-containing protein [Plectosphaerella plurivora]
MSTPTVTSTPEGKKPQQPKRLPVNPRRHKVPTGQRKRVAIACNNCNVRRVKCSGDTPCVQCRSSSRDCEYPESQATVSVTRSEIDTLRQRCAALERSLADAVPDPARRNALLAPHLPMTASSSSASPTPAAPVIPSVAGSIATRNGSEVEGDGDHEPETDYRAEGRWLHDPDGTVRYLGETSGATFLDYLKEFMNLVLPQAAPPKEPWAQAPGNGDTFIASLGQYQTYDSRPLFEPDVDPLWLPPQDEVDAMLAELRYLLQDGNGIFPSGGMLYWPDAGLDEPLGAPAPAAMNPDEDGPWAKHRHLAFYNAGFAVVCHARRTTPAPLPGDAQLGEAFFRRAKMLVGNPLDARRWTVGDVSTLALMSVYLMEMNRRDAACIHIGVAIHIAVMHGAFKGWLDERGKRVFWTLYVIDRWLSCLMGRPPTLLDDAIRLEMPMDAPNLPPAVGLQASVRISRITSYIVCNTYGIAPWDHPPPGVGGRTTQYLVDSAMQMLDDWRTSLPVALQLGTEHLSTDPIVCNLHMARNQLVVLTSRPIIFVAVKKAVAERLINRRGGNSGGGERPDAEKHPQARHMAAGLAAARWNMRIGRWLCSLYGTRRRLFHTELHYVFNAAVLIILDALLAPPIPMVVPSLPPLDEDVRSAIQIFEEDSRGGSNYSKDCTRVLADLSTLARRLAASLAWTGGEMPGQQQPHEDAAAMHPWAPDAFGQAMLGAPRTAQGAFDQELLNWMETDDLQLYSNFI